MWVVMKIFSPDQNLKWNERRLNYSNAHTYVHFFTYTYTKNKELFIEKVQNMELYIKKVLIFFYLTYFSLYNELYNRLFKHEGLTFVYNIFNIYIGTYKKKE